MKAQTATQNRRKYDEDFKRQALQMIYNGQSVRSVAQALGVGENLLHKWKKGKQSGELEKEVEQLRSRLKQVEMERDILKKALSIFSRQT